MRLTAASLERIRVLQEEMDLGTAATQGRCAGRILGRF